MRNDTRRRCSGYGLIEGRRAAKILTGRSCWDRRRICRRAALAVSIAEPKRSEPGVDLAENVLLPLIGGTLAEQLRILYETSHAARSVAVEVVEFVGHGPIPFHALPQREKGSAIGGERGDRAWDLRRRQACRSSWRGRHPTLAAPRIHRSKPVCSFRRRRHAASENRRRCRLDRRHRLQAGIEGQAVAGWRFVRIAPGVRERIGVG
jgi:hypothetical protein